MNYIPKGVLSYQDACCFMYGILDNKDGIVEGVYTTFKINISDNLCHEYEILYPKTNRVRLSHVNSKKVRAIAYNSGKGINCEHIYPQSHLKKAGAYNGVSDLHHMIPSNVKVNNVRSNYRFGEVDKINAKENHNKDFIRDIKTGRNFHPGVTLAVDEIFGNVNSWGGFWAVQKVGDKWVNISLKNIPIVYPTHFNDDLLLRAREHYSDIKEEIF